MLTLPPSPTSHIPQAGAATSSMIYSSTLNGTACVRVIYWACRKPTPRRSSPASISTGPAVRLTSRTPTTILHICIGARMDAKYVCMGVCGTFSSRSFLLPFQLPFVCSWIGVALFLTAFLPLPSLPLSLLPSSWAKILLWSSKEQRL